VTRGGNASSQESSQPIGMGWSKHNFGDEVWEYNLDFEIVLTILPVLVGCAARGLCLVNEYEDTSHAPSTTTTIAPAVHALGSP
jgi:hypothetical protein